MDNYFHSVKLKRDLCNGCTICMRRCPTEAIRIRDGKAKITNEKCIDCGACISVCPYHAKKAYSDSIDAISDYKYKVAITPLSLYGQFPLEYDMKKIMKCFKELGFDRVIDTTYGVEVLAEAIRTKLDNKELKVPAISTLCPAVIRLIQSRFPTLLENIIPVESPMEVAARIATNDLLADGIKREDIGIFYITQCPAKITSINKPLGLKESYISGAISFEAIYTKILKIYNTIEDNEIDKTITIGGGKGISWARAGGQGHTLGVSKYLAVDGIENVIKVLEEIELGKIKDIELFEGYACSTGCVGGPLNVENPYIAKYNILHRVKKDSCNVISQERIQDILKNIGVNLTEEVHPVKNMKLDNDIIKAMKKLELIEKINKGLPGKDCGSCGAPNCLAMAEDIAKGNAVKESCIFLNKDRYNKEVD